jgi:hypothetical protein
MSLTLKSKKPVVKHRESSGVISYGEKTRKEFLEEMSIGGNNGD